MDEVTRNDSLFSILNRLIKAEMYDCVLTMGKIISTDTVAMKKSFYIMCSNVNNLEILEMCVKFDNEIKTELEIKSDKEVVLQCQMCDNVWIGPEPQRCCDGYQCGCMGQPIEPTVCSGECYEKLVNRYKQ